MPLVVASKDLNPYFTEFVATARTALDHAEQAAEHYAKGDVQAACNVVNVMHYKTGELEDLRLGLVRDFEQQGVSPRIDVGDS